MLVAETGRFVVSAYYYRRYRRPGRLPLGPAAAVAAVVVVASAAGGHHHGGRSAAQDMAAVPARAPSGPFAPVTWARAFLHDDGMPESACDRAFVIAWEDAEGTYASLRNPLDSTLPMSGSYAVNPAGVQHYRSLRQGLAATVLTIRNGLYGPVQSALAAGNGPAAASAVAASRWGTQNFEVSC